MILNLIARIKFTTHCAFANRLKKVFCLFESNTSLSITNYVLVFHMLPIYIHMLSIYYSYLYDFFLT